MTIGKTVNPAFAVALKMRFWKCSCGCGTFKLSLLGPDDDEMVQIVETPDVWTEMATVILRECQSERLANLFGSAR
jgi:hypothetical protein